VADSSGASQIRSRSAIQRSMRVSSLAKRRSSNSDANAVTEPSSRPRRAQKNVVPFG
jgi:hypothetical protein